MTDDEVMGPVDYLVVEFPVGKARFTGEVADELLSLVDRGLVRVLDLLLIRKNEDGSWEVAELHELETEHVGGLRDLEEQVGLLLAEEDVLAIADVIEPGSIAGVLVYENRWAGPFGAAVRRAGGQLVANGRIPTQALLAAVGADEEGA